jgi:hypothetical protein
VQVPKHFDGRAPKARNGWLNLTVRPLQLRGVQPPMHSIDRVVCRNAGRKERTQNPQPPNVILGKVPVLPSAWFAVRLLSRGSRNSGSSELSVLSAGSPHQSAPTSR